MSRQCHSFVAGRGVRSRPRTSDELLFMKGHSECSGDEAFFKDGLPVRIHLAGLQWTWQKVDNAGHFFPNIFGTHIYSLQPDALQQATGASSGSQQNRIELGSHSGSGDKYVNSRKGTSPIGRAEGWESNRATIPWQNPPFLFDIELRRHRVHVKIFPFFLQT
jgi:hypothetical protein